MNEERSDYKIDLDDYSGPLDLLLYLIRREEVDVYDIPVARITKQYLAYLDVISDLNINVAGEFVVMAATLMEIKSRMMAPQPELGPDEEEPEDPRLELVRQLMEYKRFKEASLELSERADRRAERFGRAGERVDGGVGPVSPLPEDMTLWALLDAFARILEQTGKRAPHRIVLDDVPQEEIIERLEARVRASARISFLDAFEGETSRAILVGMFLALLELVKRQVVRVEQEEAFGEIWLTYVPEEERPKDEQEPRTEAPSDAPPEDLAEAADWAPEDVAADLPDVPEVE